MKTYSAKPTDVTRQWYVIDAADTTLGRVATEAAKLLLGKGKPQFTQHIDCGDFVVIINTDHIKVSGEKMTDKMYYRHSGFPGGLTKTQLKDVVTKDSTRAFYEAVRGMLPVNKLRDGRLARLKLYAGAEHNHAAQKPQTLSLKGDK